MLPVRGEMVRPFESFSVCQPAARRQGQNVNRSASCIWRAGVLVEVICPAVVFRSVGLLKTVRFAMLGMPKFTRLKALNTSIRSCAARLAALSRKNDFVSDG